jgi:hypothetical protein
VPSCADPVGQQALYKFRELLLAQLARRLQTEEQTRSERLRSAIGQSSRGQRQTKRAAVGDFKGGM